MERRLRLIAIHKAVASAFPWIPVFVLYTQRQFGLDGAVLLAGLYYLAVVFLEVPSGWMSDRWGRVPTLRVAAAGFCVAHICFLVGEGRFSVIVAGQVMLAVGFASLSGTDVAYRYDTLEAADRSGEFAAREARLAALGYVVTASSSLAGGLLGWIDLRLALWASLAAAVVQLLVAAVLPEPPAEPVVEATSPPEGATLADLGRVFGYLRQVRLRWLFAYGVALVTLEHVAFTLMQPWLVLVLERDLDDLGSAPVVAGVLFASVSVVGAVAARASEPAGRRFGLVPALLGLAAVSAVVVTVMAATQAPWALAVVALRSVQGAAAPVLLSAAIAPVIATRHRATYLSLNSLGGRLGYGALLVAVSPLADDPVRTLTLLAGLSWLLVFGLLFTAGSAAVGHDAD